MENKRDKIINIVVVILILFIVYLIAREIITYFYKSNENFRAITSNLQASNGGNGTNIPSGNSEAIQNIASVYNKDLLTVTNAKITGDLEVDGNISFLPKGVVMAWFGTVVPKGWALCDGTKGTPDLRGRFVLGSSDSYPIGVFGGEAEHKLLISELPSHNHGYRTPSGAGSRYTGSASADGFVGKVFTGATTQALGGDQPHNNMPPYFVLAYIMKS